MSLTLENRYDDAASWWGPAMVKLGYRAAYEDLVDRALPDGRFDDIADIGTGSGDLARAVTAGRSPGRLLLVDSSARMLDQAANSLRGAAQRIECRHASLDNIGEQDAFDLVLAGHVIEHVPDPAAALERLARLVRPGGRLLLVVSRPHWCQWLIWLRWRHSWFSARQVARMASGAGLGPLEVFGLSHGPPRRTSLAYLAQKPDTPTGADRC